MTMPECSICSHPDRTAIDEALISGASLREVEAQWGVSKSALHRHRTQCVTVSAGAGGALTQSEVVAALRDHVKRARDAARKASKDGQHQAASVALKLEGEALTRLAALLPATASAGEEPTATAPRPGGLSDEMARSIMVQTLGLSEEAADRLLSGQPPPAVATYKPAEPSADDAEQRADVAVERFEERMAEHEPPKVKAPPRRPVGTVRPFNDGPPAGCQCEPDDADQDCPVHGAARGGWGALF